MKQKSKLREFFSYGIGGLLMAMADSVPGVSGGTIAFILGFYDKFITSLDDLFTGNMKKKKDALFFLIKLGIGWVIGMAASVLVLTRVFEEHIYAVSSLFLGFILFAIPVIIIEEKAEIKRKPWACIFVLFGIALVVGISMISPSSDNSFDMTKISLGSAVYIFISGMIAICAMVLPGISGSTLLLIFGVYLSVIKSIERILHLDFSAVPMLLIFALGVITGIVLCIKLIRKSLEKFRPQMVFLILGMMIGSLYAVVVGPQTLDPPQNMLTFKTFDVLFFIIGSVVIIGMQVAKVLLQKRRDSLPAEK